eukprot:TRINITY_DN3769_c0_g1_i1.p1 TRINITY_DN3769_c0_g1~~TRINITY_DN3769_c0_g1_i1.p1  ORF type:complete len:101 (-),score=6.32 TRINITY_DN3769_c0_g1_i1:166-468(-)
MLEHNGQVQFQLCEIDELDKRQHNFEKVTINKMRNIKLRNSDYIYDDSTESYDEDSAECEFLQYRDPNAGMVQINNQQKLAISMQSLNMGSNGQRDACEN